jgi:hypothetical protein
MKKIKREKVPQTEKREKRNYEKGAKKVVRVKGFSSYYPSCLCVLLSSFAVWFGLLLSCVALRCVCVSVALPSGVWICAPLSACFVVHMHAFLPITYLPTYLL